MKMKENKKGRRFTLGLKLNLLIVCMILLVAGGLLLISYQVQANRITQEYYRRAEEAAQNGTQLISGMIVSDFRDVVSTDEFRKVREQAARANNPEIIDEWLYHHKGALISDEEFEQILSDESLTEEQVAYSSAYYDYIQLLTALNFIKDSEEVTYAYIQIVENGQTYNFVDPKLDETTIWTIEEPLPEFAQYTSNESIPATIYKSRFGWLCTACEPIYTEDTEEAVGQLCIDIDMNVIMRERRAFLLNSIFLVVLLTIVSILISIALIRWIAVNPLRRLTEATCGFGGFDEGQKRYEMKDVIDVDIRSNDEINDLYQEIRGMQISMVKFTSDLAHYTADKARINTELGLASEIQAAMLRDTFPAFPDRSEFDLYALMDPAREVGGDFYDFFLIDENHLALIIADVSGKGVPAALYMMSSMILLRNQGKAGGTPAEILSAVNQQLTQEENIKMFVTAWMGILDLQTGHMACANAGHEYPVLGKAGGEFSLYRDKHNFVLGGLDTAEYSNYQIRLNPGDVLMVYTDGVPEASDPDQQFYGTDRLLRALNSAGGQTPEELIRTIRQDMDTFTSGAEQFDDITMLCVKYNGPA